MIQTPRLPALTAPRWLRRAAPLGLLTATLIPLLHGCAAESGAPVEALGEAQERVINCVTLQRGTLGAVDDTTITANVTYPGWGGTTPTFRAGGTYESLLRFDVSAIPAGAVVTSATLNLTTTTTFSSGYLSARYASAPWSEATTTYASFNQQAGKFLGSMTPSSANTTQAMTIKAAAVQGWRDGTIENDGLVLETLITARPDAWKETVFVSSDSPTVALRPALQVCYTPLDYCAAAPCQNGASCTSGVSAYTCACAPGFTGQNCQINIDDCAGSPCLNGGACADGINSYACTCPPGFTGAQCQTDINECAPGPCQNGGVCTDQVNAYTCACLPGFTGQDCQTNIDDCSGSPCQNGGACTDGVNSYTCACAPGYAGTNCQTDVDDCVGNGCQNGSSCVDGVNSYTCACAPGFTGAFCQTNIDDCAGSPCQNGGTCNDGVNGYTCACAPGYTGTNCQIDVDDCAGSPCLNGGVCTDGVNSYTCACAPGFSGGDCQQEVGCNAGLTDCDGNTANGCETNLSSSAANCGACGQACGTGSICVQGACQAPPSGQTTHPPITVPEVHGALAPAIGDIDGDGNPDVLVANAESGSTTTPSGSLTVRRGVGDGNMQAEEYYTGAPLSSNAVVVADVNGDGWLDAITVNGQTNVGTPGSISVYLNAGASAPGVFGAPTTFTTGATGSIHLCAADFNGDGKIDIATTSVTSNQVSVLLGNGAGGFGSPQLISILSTGGVQSTIGAADLNGDGRPDLVVTSPGSTRLSVLLNLGGGAFAAPVAYSNSAGGFTAGVAFGDFDGDGVLDVISNGASGRFLYFFKGHTNGTLSTGAASTVSSSNVSNSTLGVVAGDFNGDGKLDAYVLHTATTGGVYPMTGNGAGSFSVGTQISTGASPGLNSLATADMNHDGYLDLILTNKASNTVTVILNAL
jgi:hypothetical protein